MSNRFITYVIIGVAFGFTQLWFAYWVVKLYKEKQRLVKARREAARTAGKNPMTTTKESTDSPADPAVDTAFRQKPVGPGPDAESPQPRTFPRKR